MPKDRFYRLHDEFLAAVHQLPKEVSKKVWKSLYLYSRNPGHPGLHLEKLGGKAAGLQSLRVDAHYRIVFGEIDETIALLYVGSHDDAYRIAEKRALGTWQLPRFQPPKSSSVHTHPLISMPLSIDEVGDVVQRTAKYLPLSRYLLSIPTQQNTVVLTFKEIEKIIGASLPESANRYEAWWGNTHSPRSRHSQALAWLHVGWKASVSRKDIKARQAGFARSGQ